MTMKYYSNYFLELVELRISSTEHSALRYNNFFNVMDKNFNVLTCIPNETSTLNLFASPFIYQTLNIQHHCLFTFCETQTSDLFALPANHNKIGFRNSPTWCNSVEKQEH